MTTVNKKTINHNSEENSLQNNEKLDEKVIQEFSTKRTFWDRIPKFKWWVTPLNIGLICIFLIIIDIVTLPNIAFLNIDWAWWPIGGLIFTYVVSFIIFKRPEIAWIVGPILMAGTGILLFAIDFAFPPNEGLLDLDWAIIPIVALLTFGVLIPIVTKFGRKKQKPIDKFRKAIEDMKQQEIEQQAD